MFDVLEHYIEEARDTRSKIVQSAYDLSLALEREAQARRIAGEAKRDYEALESEVSAEAMFAADAKNAEGRKAQVDVALVRSRQSGVLAQPYARMVAADYEAQDAKMALEQMAKHFKAIEIAADLSASILRAVAGR